MVILWFLVRFCSTFHCLRRRVCRLLMLLGIRPKVMEVVKMTLKMYPIPGDTYGLTNYSIRPQKAVSMGLGRKENREGNVE